MKALKFLGIALLACGLMFTSCKKDDKTTANNNSVQGGGGGGTTTTDGTTITFQGASWTAASQNVYDFSDDNYLCFYLFKVANSTDNTYLQGWMQSNTGSYDYESSNGDYFKYRDPNEIWTDEDGVLGEAGAGYYRWNADAESFTENITAIDLNAMTMSATFQENIFDVEDYVAAGGDIPETTYPLKGVMKNNHWNEWSTSKAMNAKTKATVIEKIK